MTSATRTAVLRRDGVAGSCFPRATALHCALIGLLAGISSSANAAVAGDGEPSAQDGSASGVQCTPEGCVDQGGLLFQLRTRSYDMPITQGTNAASSSEALQPDRRATIAMEQAGRAVVTGRFSIDLACGAAIWATEDPVLGQPELSVSAPTVVP